jgi:SAM-dependent methyltransferase
MRETKQVDQDVDVESAWIGERRYFANLPYALPKDGPEADRLNFQHHLVRATLKGLYLAPLEKRRLEHILDVGCGTGKWGQEMAHLFPKAQVVGLDIEKSAASSLPLPKNYTFTQGNVLEKLPFADETFDFVYQRLLVAAIPTVRWPKVVGELVRVTKPNGWIELVEGGDAYINPGPALQQLLTWGRLIGNTRGIDMGRIAYLDHLLIGMGLIPVEKRTVRVPVGRWGGHLGNALAQNNLALFAGLKALYCQELAIAPEQFDEQIAALPAEWNAYHTEFPFYVVYGQVKNTSY